MKTQPLKIVTFVEIYTEISRQYLLSGTEKKVRRVLLYDRRYHRISDKKPPVEKVSNTSPADEKSTVKLRPTTLPFIRLPL